ncbi:MAG TPA: hypothetical protein DD979_01180 [Gammaproteobacteria bacterium]|nr:hypothetical protein [Gammaproteobacteria bacterium]
MLTVNASTTAWWLRSLHWINAISMLGLITSGWAIYNAAPFYNFEFPSSWTLGGYLTSALRWHFFLIWSFTLCTLMLWLTRVTLQTGGPRLWPISLRGLVTDARAVWGLRLAHRPQTYHHIQRVLYLAVYALMGLLIVSGLGLWKPVQLQMITQALGGYEACRRWHFWSMWALVGFTVVHVAMAITVPRTLIAMLLGVSVEVKSRDHG